MRRPRPPRVLDDPAVPPPASSYHLTHVLLSRAVEVKARESVGGGAVQVVFASEEEGDPPQRVDLIRFSRAHLLRFGDATQLIEKARAEIAAANPSKPVDWIDDLIDGAAVALFGNGGGTSVLACDAFARHALLVPPFDPLLVEQLEALALPPGASVLNPVDAPVGVLSKDEGAVVGSILDIVQRAGDIDAIVVHLNLPVIVGYYDETLLRNLITALLRSRDAAARKLRFVLVLRSDGSAAVDEIRRTYRDEAMAIGIAVYDEIPQAAQALAALAWIERFGGPAQGASV